MNFSLSGLDLKLLFMVTGAYYEGGLISPFITVIVRLVLVQHMRSWRGGTSTGAGRSKTFLCSFRRVGRGGANAPPPPPRAEKVRLERAIDEKKDAKDESFLLIFQRTLLFTV